MSGEIKWNTLFQAICSLKCEYTDDKMLLKTIYTVNDRVLFMHMYAIADVLKIKEISLYFFFQNTTNQNN